jgi:hypothetical protein
MSEANSRGGDDTEGTVCGSTLGEIGQLVSELEDLGVIPVDTFGPVRSSERDEAEPFSWPAIVVVKGSREGEPDLFLHRGQWMLDAEGGAVPAKGTERAPHARPMTYVIERQNGDSWEVAEGGDNDAFFSYQDASDRAALLQAGSKARYRVAVADYSKEPS